MPNDPLSTEIVVCPHCNNLGWVCENHPDVPFPDGDCGSGEPCGAGMPCTCNPKALPIEGSTVIWTAEDGYAN